MTQIHRTEDERHIDAVAAQLTAAYTTEDMNKEKVFDAWLAFREMVAQRLREEYE